MASSTPIRLIIFLVLGLSGCLGQTAQSPRTSRLSSIEALRNQLSSVRDLKFNYDVPISVEPRESLESYIATDIQGTGGKRLEDTSLAYAKLGLLPGGIDLRSSLLAFYSSQTLAFYDSRAKKVVLVGSRDGRSDTPILGQVDEKVLVHELTHALQDQAFLLGDKLRASGNGDATIALRSVAEGDALLTEYAYSFGGLDGWLPGYIRQLFHRGVEETVLPGTPALVRDKLLFQYRAGTRFLSHFLGNDGWVPINLMYKYPPLSTEQILHPEKYFAVPDPPTRIELKNLSSLFSSEWREIENDTLGELLVQCLFNEVLAPAEAAAVANGWDGDRFVAYRNGDEVAFIWATFWDSAKDAREFYDNYQEILQVKHGTPTVSSHFYIERRDRAVIIVEGLEQDEIKRNIDTIWIEMVLEEEKFQPPPFSSRISSP